MTQTSYINVSSAAALSADITAIDQASQASGGNGTNYSIVLAPGVTLTDVDPGMVPLLGEALSHAWSEVIVYAIPAWLLEIASFCGTKLVLNDSAAGVAERVGELPTVRLTVTF